MTARSTGGFLWRQREAGQSVQSSSMKVVDFGSGMRKAAILPTFLLALGSASADSWGMPVIVGMHVNS